MYAFLAGVIAIIIAFLFGKRSSTTKISGEVTIQKKRAEEAEQKLELSQKVSESVVQLSKEQTEAKEEISEALDRLEIADKQRDTNAALGIAKHLAEIAQRLI